MHSHGVQLADDQLKVAAAASHAIGKQATLFGIKSSRPDKILLISVNNGSARPVASGSLKISLSTPLVLLE